MLTFVQIQCGSSYSNAHAGLGLAHTQLGTGTLQQLVQQCTSGTRHPPVWVILCSSSSSNAQAGRDILQCGSYSTVVQRQCEHAASNAKRERVSTTPNTPLPHASSTPTAPLTRVSYTCYTNCYNTQKGKMVLPLLRTLPLRTPLQILLAIAKLLES